MRHDYYYYDAAVIDLNKLREESKRRAAGDKYNGPDDSVIHFHYSIESCGTHVHENYGPGHEDSGDQGPRS